MLTRWSPFDELFNFQREVDRLFNHFWSDLPTRMATAPHTFQFQVNATDDGWHIDVPMPGIDPQFITLDVAGNTLSVRAEVPGGDQKIPVTRYEQTITIPQFLDVDRVNAAYRHGMLQLTLPLKESVKPRRVQIDVQSVDRKQLTAA